MEDTSIVSVSEKKKKKEFHNCVLVLEGIVGELDSIHDYFWKISR